MNDSQCLNVKTWQHSNYLCVNALENFELRRAKTILCFLFITFHIVYLEALCTVKICARYTKQLGMYYVESNDPNNFY
jgi:DMSO/TMAO reductase YedYZ heme-binding membrane subunit